MKAKPMLVSVWKKLIALTRRYPVIVVPFLIAMAIDVIVLGILFLSPRPPLSIVIAPIVRAFWGEQYVHYPFNFLLLPVLFNYARTILSFFTGITLTAICVAFIGQAYEGARPQWIFGIKKAVLRYIRLFLVWAMILAAILLSLKAAGYFFPDDFPGSAARLIQYAVSMLFQILFAFAIPAVIIENRKTFPAVSRSLSICRRHPAAAIMIVLVPSLLFIPLAFADSRLGVLIERTAPEIVLAVLLARILIVGLIDFLVSGSAAVMLLVHKGREKTGGAQS